MIQKILIWPHAELKFVAKPVTEVDEEIRRILDDMVDTMLYARGAGLAAPQIGVSKRLVVLKVRESAGAPDASRLVGEERPDDKWHILKLVNPRVVELSKDLQPLMAEGCLSLPGYWQPMQRANFCRVEALDEKGEQVEICGDGFVSIQLQHELDHLDGRTLPYYLSDLRRDQLRSRFQKAKKAGLKYVLPDVRA